MYTKLINIIVIASLAMSCQDEDSSAKDNDKDWELHTYVGNIFNRCAVYPAHYWHAPFNAGFGYDKKTGRLVQVFFFNSEKTDV